MSNEQKTPISVEATTTVTLSYERFMALKNVEADKERYAQHIMEHQVSLDAANLRIEELEKQITELSTKGNKVKQLPDGTEKPVKATKKK